MSITKNYFYCLTSDGLKLENDYIEDIQTSSKIIENINLKNFVVEVQDEIDDKTTITYSTDAPGGTSIDENGITHINHWQTLVVISYPSTAVGSVNGYMYRPITNVTNAYEIGDFYTKVSDFEDNNGVPVSSSIPVIGIKDNYNMTFDSTGLGNNSREYKIDFYLFLHVNGNPHIDSQISVECGNITHPSLAIAKTSKIVNIFQKVEGKLLATGFDTSNPGSNLNQSWLTYQTNTSGRYNSSTKGIEIFINNTKGVVSIDSWFKYIINTPYNVFNSNTAGKFVEVISNSSSWRAVNFSSSDTFVIGVPLIGASSIKSGPNIKHIYVIINNSFSTYYGEVGSVYKTSFKLPTFKIKTLERSSLSIIDNETSTLTLSLDNISNTGITNIDEFVQGSHTYELSLSDCKNLLTRFYNVKYIIKNIITNTIYKEYIYNYTTDQIINLPQGNWKVELIAEYPADTCYFKDMAEIYLQGQIVLGSSDIITILVNGNILAQNTDLKFLKLHKSQLLGNCTINYHNLYPFGVYFEGNNILEQNLTNNYYGETVNCSNYENILSSPLKEKGIFYKSIFFNKITELIDETTGENYEVKILYTGEVFNNNSFEYITIPIDIEIGGFVVIPTGKYKVLSYTENSINIFLESALINAPMFDTYVSNSYSFEFTKYFWNEVYTTPIGLYDTLTIESDKIIKEIIIEDVHTVPTDGSYLIVQYLPNEILGASSGTDGINNIPYFFNQETYIYQITSVTQIGNTFDIDVDKNFINIVGSGKYLLILLNRNWNTEDLYNSLWQQREIHRDQMLGDNTSSKKNYINYKGSEYFGIKSQLQDLLPVITGFKTPFTVLNLNEQIKDRITIAENISLEIPYLIIQKNNGVEPAWFVNNINELKNDNNSLGNYSPLYTLFNSVKKIGYILHDLNLVLLFDTEITLALGYSSNRNYTLLPITAGETFSNITPTGVSFINEIRYDTTIGTTIISLNQPHNYKDGDIIYIKDVPGANSSIFTSTPDNILCVYKVIDQDSFYVAKYISGVYGNINWITEPILLTTPSFSGRPGYTYSNKPSYEYFITYNIENEHCESILCGELIPFNFSIPSKNEDGSYNNATSLFKVNLPQFNITSVNMGSMIANIIIGKYDYDIEDPYNITGVKDLKIVNTIPYVVGEEVTVDLAGYLNSINIYEIESELITTMATPHILIGNLSHKEQVTQYGLTFNIKAEADKWNKSVNPTFDEGNSLHNKKLISEIAFHITNRDGNVNSLPLVYAKISPPIVKDNLADLNIKINLEF